MYVTADEKTVSRIISVGALLTSLIVITGTVSDPVNAPKLLLLGGVSFALLGVIGVRARKIAWSQNIPLCIALGLFLVGITIAISFSNSPFTQNIYGTYGRNTGFLAYLFLGLILFATAGLRNLESIKFILLGFFLTGTGNVLYGVWVLTLGDPIGWTNPYGALLGTFGNPNFISSFLGLYSAVVAAYILQTKLNLMIRAGGIALILLNVFQISKTDSIQGYVVTATCLGFVIFLRLKDSRLSKLSWAFLTSLILAGGVAVAGVFKAGPFATFLYQGTMAFREQYWRAAINMGMAHPLTGVGMDSYGDNYRLYRDIKSLTTPGVSVITNTPHNVVLEFFASGGVILLIAYLLILSLALISLVRVLRRMKKYDFVFATLASAWIGFQLQSLISINQLGLAVWGWILTGALIAYDFATRNQPRDSVAEAGTKSKVKSRQVDSILSPGLLAGVGGLVGLLLAVPAISADTAWISATKSGNYIEVQNSLKSTYLHPQDSNRLVQFVQMLESSNLNDQARTYAIQATDFNPNHFDSWLALYLIKNSSANDKAEALRNLKRLDPRNPDPTKR
jgi:O-antigen ligase